ncbi:transposase [Palleronia rufa]|uniref:transposase n=1 Tax=Palleronia rufa TaxID=1530186 RepID=UPI0009DF490D
MGTRRDDDRPAVNGIFHVRRTGAPWRDLPDRYGPLIMGQPLRLPGQARYPSERVRGLGPALAAVTAVDRQVHRPRPPARLGPK